jgi:hypothetical protein
VLGRNWSTCKTTSYAYACEIATYCQSPQVVAKAIFGQPTPALRDS